MKHTEHQRMGAQLSGAGGPSSRGGATKLPLIPHGRAASPSGGQCQVWEDMVSQASTPTKGRWGENAGPVQLEQIQGLKSGILQCLHVTVWMCSLKFPPAFLLLSQRAVKGLVWAAFVSNRRLSSAHMPTIRSNSYLESNFISK